MLNIENQNIFGKVIADALAAVERNMSLTSGSRLRWINAIGKAAARIESNDFLMTWQAENETLVIWTVGTTNEVYEANGACQCKAFLNGVPCWHKAAKQLIKNYYAALETKPPESKEQLVLDVIKGEKHYSELYLKNREWVHKQGVSEAIQSLKDKGVIRKNEKTGLLEIIDNQPLESKPQDTPEDITRAPYLKPSGDYKPVKIGSVRI